MPGKDENIIEAEKEFEIKALEEEIRKLKNQVSKYQVLLKEIDEDADPNTISDEEIICINEIAKLKEKSQERPLTNDEVKNLDVLHRNLKLARGENVRVKSENKTRKMNNKDLENIAKGK